MPEQLISTEEQPINYFRWLTNDLYNGIEIKWIMLKNSFIHSEEDGTIVSNYDNHNIDETEKKIVYSYMDVNNGKYITREETFENYLFEELVKEYEKSRRLIDSYVLNHDNEQINKFLSLTLDNIHILINSQVVKVEYPFLKEPLTGIKNGIVSHINRLSLGNNQSVTNHFWSFDLLVKSDENKESKIKALYDLLVVEPPLIGCTNQDQFVKAFSGKEVEEGIKWLVTGQNKLISKTSLFYFIEKLNKHDFIINSVINDLNKYVKYVFRYPNGDVLKNLKQSKSTYSKKVTLQDRIDSIISSL